MNRASKIKFLRDLQAGKKSLSELTTTNNEMKYYCFVQKGKNEYSGLYGKLLTEDEISNLPGPGCAVIIMNPHLEETDESSIEPLTAETSY